MLFMFSFLIISSRLLLPDHRIIIVILSILLLFLLIDVPFILIDGWVGRYPPRDQEFDKTSGPLGSNSRLAQKRKFLKRFYILVDIIYVTVAILALSAWILTDYFTVGITKRVYVVSGIYLIAMATTIMILLVRGSRKAVCACMPYFLGPFIVRCIRFYYKRTGQYDKFGNGDAIHEYIGC